MSTAPENLEPVIKEMQAVEQELEILNTPSCALRIKAALDSYTFSKVQCHFQIYTIEGLGHTRPPEISDPKIDLCELALEQFEYYQTQRDSLEN